MMNPAKIILITGVMASGKSTIAQLLAEKIPCSVHLRGDVFRRMVVNGRVDMSANPTPAALAQLHLRYKASFQVAQLYWASGFNVIYQDVIIGPMLTDVVKHYQNLPLHVFVLNPQPSVVALREQKRGKTGYSGITVAQLQTVLEATERIGEWIDSSEQLVDETTQALLARMDNARIDWDYNKELTHE
ncbi:MAG: AAA family ATPase [Chloroflexota bacterium]